ncbi:uncharacterized protein LOC135949285 [Calliphora vicina]|uniref:uncharacterized protein LOC135949285 n=1 Tax=Calliphora vicina TaxID=7373 RepID=UPI00325B50FA
MSSNKNRNPNWHWSCGICKDDHPLKSCQRFLKSDPYQRFETIINKHYCQNCLARSHLTSQCLSKLVCRECSRRHHTLLHEAPQLKAITETKRHSSAGPTRKQNFSSRSSTSSCDDSKDVPIQGSTKIQHSTKSAELTKKPDMTSPKVKPKAVENNQFVWTKVFVPTATVKITHNKMEIWYPIRAVINQSLTISRISRSCVQKLILPTKNIQGFQFAKFQIKTRHENSRWTREIKALITQDLPKRPYSGPMKKDPSTDFGENLLADLAPTSNTPIDLELGSDLYPAIRRDAALDSALEQVIAVKTALGYVFSGPAEELELN